MTLRINTPRLTALLASMVMTAVLLGSQLGIAENYTAQADAVMAARHATPMAQNASGAAPRRHI